MASIRANLFRCGFTFANLLGFMRSDGLANRLKKLSAKGYGDGVSEGFLLTREKTPSGTKYQRVIKDNSAKNGKIIYYCHGGGYIVGLLAFYKGLAKDLCEASGADEVIFLDYGCAPEHQYPSQLNEAADLWSEVTEHQGYKPENIILGGDSAGAHLAISLMLKLRDEGYALPCAAFCFSPWIDMSASGSSIKGNFGRDVLFGRPHGKLTEEGRLKSLEGELYCFLGNADRSDPYVSPVFADFYGFPPMFLTVGGDEIILDDTLRLVEKLKKEKIPVEYDIQPKMFHVYPLFRGIIPESTDSYNKLLNFLKGVANEEIRTCP